MKVEKIIYIGLIIYGAILLNSCKSLDGSYSLKPGCGYSAIKILSKNEFLLYSNNGHNDQGYWNYGNFIRRNNKIDFVYKEIPEKLKYASRNSVDIELEQASDDSIRIEVQALTFDTITLDFFQIGLSNLDLKYFIEGLSHNGDQLKFTVNKNVLPLKLKAGLFGENKMSFDIIDPQHHKFTLYFDNFPTPKYNTRVGVDFKMLIGKDSIGKYLVNLNGENKEDYRYYKNR